MCNAYDFLVQQTQLAGAVECTNYISADEKDTPLNEYLGYDGEAPVILELWGMQSTRSVVSLPGQL